MPAGWKLRERTSFTKAQADQEKMRQDSELLPRALVLPVSPFKTSSLLLPSTRHPCRKGPTSEPVVQLGVVTATEGLSCLPDLWVYLSTI